MERTICLAGGCFWGVEKLFRSLPGVLDVTVGYANGTIEEPEKYADYRTVCTGRTGFREAAMIRYDDTEISLRHLLFAFFAVIDPTTENRQGMDFGTQYQTGIYWTDPGDETVISEIISIEAAAIEAGGTNYYDDAAEFCVEAGPLVNFYPAEEYHQRYLEKNPHGYCHIFPSRVEKIRSFAFAEGKYTAPAQKLLRIW